ncbi:diaminopimelate epimerase [Streptomyces sp. NPDC087270]|uniref:diaminopimelate epimerase n=2 Tax=unclassified Streptomyces TaxID=2593676 RepID=UPI00381FC63E
MKLHGAGNDFVLLSRPDPDGTTNWTDTARHLCARRTGIGADGLVLTAVTSTDPLVLDVTCLNADGSVATMCGNALRCVAWWAAAEYGRRSVELVMDGVKHQALVEDDEVWVTAEVGETALRRVEGVIDGRPFWYDAAHTGTEHVVAVVPDVDRVDTDRCGRMMRHHPQLAPLGTNVNFVQVTGPDDLRIRTYERGVEAETLSCGSGAVAAVVIARLRGLVTDGQATVHNRSETPLRVRPHAERHSTFWVGGPVTQVYRGELT